MVILGAGQAGLVAALELRCAGYDVQGLDDGYTDAVTAAEVKTLRSPRAGI